MKTDPNAPINPSLTRVGEREHCAGGLTKREWFTGMALEGLLSDHDQMRSFEDSARKAAKVLVAEKKKAGVDVDPEEQAREALDTLIAFRAVEIADMTILRLNATDDDVTPTDAGAGEKAAP